MIISRRNFLKGLLGTAAAVFAEVSLPNVIELLPSNEGFIEKSSGIFIKNEDIDLSEIITKTLKNRSDQIIKNVLGYNALFNKLSNNRKND